MSKKNFPSHEDFLKKYDELDELNMLSDPLKQYSELKTFLDVLISYSDDQPMGNYREGHREN
jgi:hypothetical protein